MTLDEINGQIDAVSARLRAATDEQDRQRLDAELTNLEQQKAAIQRRRNRESADRINAAADRLDEERDRRATDLGSVVGRGLGTGRGGDEGGEG